MRPCLRAHSARHADAAGPRVPFTGPDHDAGWHHGRMYSAVLFNNPPYASPISQRPECHECHMAHGTPPCTWHYGVRRGRRDMRCVMIQSVKSTCLCPEVDERPTLTRCALHGPRLHGQTCALDACWLGRARRSLSACTSDSLCVQRTAIVLNPLFVTTVCFNTSAETSSRPPRRLPALTASSRD